MQELAGDGGEELAARVVGKTPVRKSAFDTVFRREGIEIIRIPFRAPRANAFAERWVGTIRPEALDQLLISGRRHREHVLGEFVDHYHGAWPHQSLGQLVPGTPLKGGISGPDRSCAGIAWAASSMSTAGSLDG